MKKIFTILLLFAMTLTILFVVSCSDGSSGGSSGGISINPLTDDMKKCAPDLASSVITEWSGWSGAADYGVLRKHFDSDNPSVENIYGPAKTLDPILTDIMKNLPADVLEKEKGDKTLGEWKVTYERITKSVDLPAILSDNGVSSPVTDFTNYMTFTGKVNLCDYKGYFYYKPAGTDGIEKILYRNTHDENHDGSVIYAIRNTKTKKIEVWTAYHKTATPPDSDAGSLMYFEGNTDDQNFKVKIKTSSATGWAFWGGGSIASNDSYIAVRGTDTATSKEITESGDDTTYVILKFKDLKASSGIAVKEGTTANFNDETGDAAEAVKYIQFGTDCLHASAEAAKAFKSPTQASELDMPGGASGH